MSSFSQTVHKKIFTVTVRTISKFRFTKDSTTQRQPRHHQTQFTKLGRHNDLHSVNWPANIIPLDDI